MQNNSQTTRTAQKDYIKEYLYIVVLAILFCCVVSIVTYDPNDPSTFHRISNQDHKLSNYFGPFGASVADWLFQLFGLGVIVFLILFILQILHVFRRSISKTQIYLKIFGYPQLIFFYLGFMSGIKPLTNFKGIQILTGGVIGNKIFELSHDAFGTSGSLVILFIGAISSLTLCLGIKPLSSVLWLLNIIPFKHTKNFAKNVSEDLHPVVEDIFNTQAQSDAEYTSSIQYHTNQNVFLELTSIIELDNENSVREILESKEFQNINNILPFPYGKTSDNKYFIFDLALLTSLIVECEEEIKKTQIINILILSLMIHNRPSEMRLILIDPQMIELSHFNNIGHLLVPIVTSANKCLSIFEYLVDEMEKRILLLKQFKAETFGILKNHLSLPYIVIVVNELFDIMISSSYKLKSNLQKIQYKGHSVGIYLVCITQKKSMLFTDCIYNQFFSKLYIYHDKSIFISNNKEDTLEKYSLSFSTNEITTITNKLRTLYPFCFENIKII